MRRARGLFATGASGLVGALIVWASQLSLGAPAEGALLRLSWRMEGLAIESCRALSAEELAALPSHMRRSEECTRHIVDYEVRIDAGGVTTIDTVGPSGARRDRPVYVLADRPLSPGAHVLRLSFVALVPDGFEAQDRTTRYDWSGVVEVGPGDVALFTLDEEQRAFRRIGGQ